MVSDVVLRVVTANVSITKVSIIHGNTDYFPVFSPTRTTLQVFEQTDTIKILIVVMLNVVHAEGRSIFQNFKNLAWALK
jgi:hypothetical protein